jgi:dephospho-CoA kinase
VNAGRLIVGLTGGIGSGKSAVASIFEQLGINVVDTDVIAHELTGPGGIAMPDLIAQFGPGIATPGGALDRAAMRGRVFADPAERKALESILHPMIRKLGDERVAAAQSPYVILMVPLLVESGSYRERVNRIAVVDCPRETQITRVMARNGLRRDEVERILAAQASREERLAAADDVIDNGGDLAATTRRITELDQFYRRNTAILPTSS